MSIIVQLQSDCGLSGGPNIQLSRVYTVFIHILFRPADEVAGPRSMFKELPSSPGRLKSGFISLTSVA